MRVRYLMVGAVQRSIDSNVRYEDEVCQDFLPPRPEELAPQQKALGDRKQLNFFSVFAGTHSEGLRLK
jgi:hypothetical protein